jgi:hypothetical protein
VKVKLLFLLLLLPACASERTHNNYWDQYSPKNTKCPDSHIAICRKHGAYMICECKKRTRYV